MQQSELDAWHMNRAIELAALGEGYVEPNPMVGAIVARGAEIIGEGWHRKFGGPHAEIEALRIAGSRARGATLYVTLEPCCHQGKTPPCTEAILRAEIGRVVVAQQDPFPQVCGQGLARLREAGIEVVVGVQQEQAQRLNAPYLKLVRTGRPWVIAKWAMTLDGKIASTTGDSRWISGEVSRSLVHRLRGRVDAVVVGRRTAERDDPLLTARPPGPRTATRIVVDTAARLSTASQLVRTTAQGPVLVAVGRTASVDDRLRLQEAGCEVLVLQSQCPSARLDELLSELGRRKMTNVLVEGGGELLGSLFDLGAIDEVYAFIAPKLIGGGKAPSPIAGEGIEQMAGAVPLVEVETMTLGPDFCIHGRVGHSEDR